MGTGVPSWSKAVGSCLAIQASILMAGSLLGVNHQLEPQGLAARAVSLPEGRRTLPDSHRPITAP